MVRRCLERCDRDSIRGRLRLLRVLSDTRPVGTQGPVWQIEGRKARRLDGADIPIGLVPDDRAGLGRRRLGRQGDRQRLEVRADESKDIFDGLMVKTGLLGAARYVPAERVTRIFEGRIELDVTGDALPQPGE